MNRILTLLLMVFLLSGCKKESSDHILVDEAFQPFVDAFIEEAAKRGIAIDFADTGLQIVFGDTPPSSNGVCKGFIEGQTSGHDIVIHRNRWNEANQNARERLIFHELGHCELYRAHTSDTLSNGEWKSIMRGVPPAGYGYRSINFTGTRRNYYIDELFDAGTRPPDWAGISVDYDDFPEVRKGLLFEVENKTEFYRSTDLSGDYEIEMTITFSTEFQFNSLGFAWGGLSEDEAMQVSVSGGNNILIINRLEDFGVIRSFENYPGFRLNGSHVLTVRRVDDRYYYFFDRHFLYWTDVEPLKTNAVQILGSQDMSAFMKRLTVKRLLP